MYLYVLVRIDEQAVKRVTDKGKIINALELAKKQSEENGLDRIIVPFKETDMILALLKEQEPIEPEVEVLNEIDRLYRCPKCHKCFFYEKQKYCDQCGQAVKWE